jgi:predicted kinase
MKAFLLVGPPGVGKSTHAAKLAPDVKAFVLNGDSIRKQLYGDESIQGNWGEIWERTEELLAENVGRCIIVDNTNCRADYRAETLTLLRSYGYTEIEAIVFRKPLETCLMQNANRTRNVPKHVITQMFADLERSFEGMALEGFSKITVLS